MISPLTVEPIPAFNDNYIWLIRDGRGQAFVVDPGDAGPVLDVLAHEQLTLVGVLITHHHPDHIGGLETLRQATGCEVWGPDNPGITGIDHPVHEGDSVSVLGTSFSVLEVPGHTLDHIVYYSEGALFCGDTLFAGGCGRVFEGTFPMMRDSLNKLAQLPVNVAVYCAHEYTMSNLDFALAADPDNAVLKQRREHCQQLRDRQMPTVPSTLSEELETNPFLRWTDQAIIAGLQRQGRLQSSDPDAVFASLRSWKDNF